MVESSGGGDTAEAGSDGGAASARRCTGARVRKEIGPGRGILARIMNLHMRMSLLIECETYSRGHAGWAC
jgi:hypothetical protein